MDTIKLADIKKINYNNILRFLVNNTQVTVSDIAGKTNLSIPTVKKFVDFSLTNNILYASEIAESTGGRKPIVYALNKDYLSTLYIVVDNNDLIITLKNFCNATLVSRRKNINLADIMEEISYAYDSVQSEYHNVKFICIGLPCIVVNGVIKEWYYSPKNNNIDVISTLENKYDVKVIIENDMKATVRAYGDRNGNGNVATVQFGHNGIGVGIMLDGRVLRGENGFAGEVGYIGDINKNIKSIRYCAKIVRSIICLCNPSILVFYLSFRQNDSDRIMEQAFKDLPLYVRPQVIVNDEYIKDILCGLQSIVMEELSVEI